jgi:hypothetical protein
MISIGMLLLSAETVMATPFKKNGDVVSNFIHTLVTKGEVKAKVFC